MNRYIYDHIVIIGVDGMGNFNSKTETPNMDKIFGKGAQTFSGLSLYPTISAQNWGAMLLGVEPDVHGLTNSIVGSKENTNRDIPSLFSAVRKAYPDALLCSCCNWNPINFGIIEHDIGVEFTTAGNDEELTEKIEECISKKPKLLFIQFDDVDGAGHKNDYGSEKHLEQIRKTDGYIGRIYDACKKAGIAENTLFVEIADHGGFDHGHGGYTPEEKFIYLAAAGKTVKQGEIETAQTKDIYAIALHAFGLDRNEYDIKGYSSQVPFGIFEDITQNTYNCDSLAYNAPLTVERKLTPDINSENGLYSYFNRDDFKFALFFDSNMEDATGKIKFTENGHPKFYTNGIMGSMGELGSIGYLSSEDVKFGNDSFSFALWLKSDKGHDDDCYICATKKTRIQSKGFAIALNAMDVKIYIEDEKETEGEYLVFFNFEEPGPWIHAVFSVDKINKEINIYLNFEKKKTVKLLPEFDISLDNETFIIGNECSVTSNNERNNFIFNIDDMLCFNRALNQDDVEKLKEYYGISIE